MAKIKYEVLAHYHKANGLPLHRRLFGEIGALAPLGSMFSPLSNWAVNNTLSKWIAEKVIGVDRRRDMPTFVRPTLEQWFRKRRSRHISDKKVVLFSDTFTNYSEPSIGKAAVELLEACGFEVLLPEKRCCGRPLISEGMLDRAIENASYNINTLRVYADEGIPIIGCEPSCTSAITDDYVELIGTPDAKRVAEATYSFEEFFARLVEEDELPLEFSAEPRDILLHGHCHQRALVGIQPTVKMLSLPTEHKVTVIDSSCCGMAGAFGYEKAHYELSMKIGELRLFEAVREKPPGSFTLSAAGFSCRHQLEHGTGVQPKHPVEVLRESITQT
jgi:Fe-S oxidoreductase